MLVKIGDLAAKCGISNRTLRYWEDAGIVKSCRTENGYRYFDVDAIRRIEIIIMLRQLKMSIQDIQNIFTTNDLNHAINVFQKHLERTRREAEELKSLSYIIERLVKTVEAHSNMSQKLLSLEENAGTSVAEFENTLKNILLERNKGMSENSGYSIIDDVRIVNLPRMVFACYRAESSTPENDCSAVIEKFIEENSLHLKYGFRRFGFNNPDPQEGNPVYGYEMWVVVPENFEVKEPLWKKEFSGGLFASIPARLSVIGERWNLLWNWAMNNDKYEIEWNPETDRRWFEEILYHDTAHLQNTDMQLDLLAPIKVK